MCTYSNRYSTTVVRQNAVKQRLVFLRKKFVYIKCVCLTQTKRVINIYMTMNHCIVHHSWVVLHKHSTYVTCLKIKRQARVTPSKSLITLSTNACWWRHQMFVCKGLISPLWKLWHIFSLFKTCFDLWVTVPHQLCHFKLRHLLCGRSDSRWECVLWLHSKVLKEQHLRSDNTEI